MPIAWLQVRKEQPWSITFLGFFWLSLLQHSEQRTPNLWLAPENHGNWNNHRNWKCCMLWRSKTNRTGHFWSLNNKYSWVCLLGADSIRKKKKKSNMVYFYYLFYKCSIMSSETLSVSPSKSCPILPASSGQEKWSTSVVCNVGLPSYLYVSYRVGYSLSCTLAVLLGISSGANASWETNYEASQCHTAGKNSEYDLGKIKLIKCRLQMCIPFSMSGRDSA